MKSFSAISYVEADVRSIGAPVHVPSFAWQALIAVSDRSFDVVGEAEAGHRGTGQAPPGAEIRSRASSSAPPLTSSVTTMLPNGSTDST